MTSDDDDAAEAGPSKEVWSSRSGTSVTHHQKKHVAAKKARSDVQGQTQQATPPRRLSTVCSIPPLQILDTPPRREPHSPHLDSSSPGNSIPPQQQQHSDMDETNMLEMQPLSKGMSPPAPVSKPPQQSTPPPQHSPTTPVTQGPDHVFWNIWARQQATNEDCLRRQTQMFASLPCHLRRLNRNMSRQNEQTTRIGNTMELMRALNVTLTNLNETLRSMHQKQTSSSSGTTTPNITPVSSPPRRSTRARQHDSAKGKGQDKQPTKKKLTNKPHILNFREVNQNT
ncbi:polycystin-1-like protein 3 [Pseudophryne corroboree]|uniref:polycystin-1-like protein 3 n=1 Tax=Pseudophryne corroboree TaxID=495146 RepID=UPI003081E27B